MMEGERKDLTATGKEYPDSPERGLLAEVEKTTGKQMPLGLRLWFDDKLFNRAKLMAQYLSGSGAMVPKHLRDKNLACFFVVEKSLLWNLSPSAVAASTFQIEGSDKVGFEGKLVHAIIEASGRLEPGSGGVSYEHFGPWEKLDGRFEIAVSKHGRNYAKPQWEKKDAEGLGVVVSAHLKGEAAPRKFTFLLVQAYPLNSTLWATDPRTQICYLAVRRFGNAIVPHLLMGVPFDDSIILEHSEIVAEVENLKAVPAPTRKDIREQMHQERVQKDPEPEEEEEEEDESRYVTNGGNIYAITDNSGEAVWEGPDPHEFVTLLLAEANRVKATKGLLDGLWEVNSPQFSHLPTSYEIEGGMVNLQSMIRDTWPKYERAK